MMRAGGCKVSDKVRGPPGRRRDRTCATVMGSIGSEASLLEFVGRIYAAAEDPRLWEPFLRSLSDAVHAEVAALVSEDLRAGRASVASSVRFEGQIAREYEAYYAARNPWMTSGVPLPRDGVVTGEMLLPDSQLVRTEYYNEFLCRLRLRHVAGAIFARPGRRISHLSLLRGRRRGPFDDAEVRFVRGLAPHLERAIQIHTRLTDLQAECDAIHDALDRVAVGIVLLDARGATLLVNRAASEILASRDGLQLERDRLCASAPGETAALRILIGGSVATGRGESCAPGGALAISRPSMLRSYSVLVSPLRGAGQSAFGELRPATAIFITDPDRAVEAPGAALRRAHRLTPAEARVAELLLQGRDVAEAARALQISLNTARTHVRHLLEKVGVRRYSELVRVMLLSCAPVRAPFP